MPHPAPLSAFIYTSLSCVMRLYCRTAAGWSRTVSHPRWHRSLCVTARDPWDAVTLVRSPSPLPHLVSHPGPDTVPAASPLLPAPPSCFSGPLLVCPPSTLWVLRVTLLSKAASRGACPVDLPAPQFILELCPAAALLTHCLLLTLRLSRAVFLLRSQPPPQSAHFTRCC